MPAGARTLDLYLHGPDPAPPATGVPSSPPDQGTVHAWFAPLDLLDPARDAWRAFLDREELERARRFRFARDRRRFELAHGLLRAVLGAYLDLPPASLVFQRGPHGKPAFSGHALQFNLSDTKDAVLIGVSMVDPIGADIETLDREVDHEAVGAHYFTPEEVDAIRAGGAHGKDRFLLYWTRKEAVLKASGVGIMEDLRALRVDSAHHQVMVSHPEFMRMAAPAYHVTSLRPSDTHLISLATPGPIRRVHLFDASRMIA